MKKIHWYIFMFMILMMCTLLIKKDYTIVSTVKNNYFAVNNGITFPNTYNIDKTNMIVSNIKNGITVNDFINSISSNSTLNIIDNNNNIVTDLENIKTGYRLKVAFDNTSDYYKLSVKGDVLGEGTLTINGAKTVARHITDKNVFKDNVFLLAADYDNNGSIKINDITKMVRDYNNTQSSSSKELTARFIVQDSTIAKTDETLVTCKKENSNSCEIIVPILTSLGDDVVLGWNIDKNASNATVTGGNKITISSDMTYYSITKKDINVSFVVGDGSAASINYTTATCTRYNSNACTIKTPTITVKSGYNVVGFGMSENDTNPIVGNNSDLPVKNNGIYYTITSKPVTITFKVGDEIANVNIKAQKLLYSYTDKSGNTVIEQEGETVSKTCISYNSKGCTVPFPTIYSPGNYVLGFSNNYEPGVIPNWLTWNNNITLYSRVGYYINPSDYSNERVLINVSETLVYGNIVVGIESGISTNRINEIKNYLNLLYSYYPQLFYYNGTLFICSENTFNNSIGNFYNQAVISNGVSINQAGYSNVYIKIHNNNDNILGTITHEIGHTMDYENYNYYKEGIIEPEDGRLINTKTVKDLFNKYKNLNPRPLTDYAYSASDAFEFVPEAFKVVIRELLYTQTGSYPYAEDGTSENDIKRFVTDTLNNQYQHLVKTNQIRK